MKLKATLLGFAVSSLLLSPISSIAAEKIWATDSQQRNWSNGTWKLTNGDSTSAAGASDSYVGSQAVSSGLNVELNGNFTVGDFNVQSAYTTSNLNIRARDDSTFSILNGMTYGGGFIMNFFQISSEFTVNVGDATHQGSIYVTNDSTFSFGGNDDARRLNTFNYTGPSTPTTTVDSGSTLKFGIASSDGLDSSYSLGHVVNNGIIALNRTESYTAEVSMSSLSGAGQFLAADSANEAGSDLTITQDTNTTFSGTLDNNGTGDMTLTKAGSGTLELSGANSFGGGTTISAGELQVTNGSGSGLGSGSVAVENGGMLSGTGTITLGGGESMTVASGGSVLGGVGAASGVLNLDGDVTFADGSEIAIALGAAGANSELARDGGTWTFDSDQVINFLDLGAELTTYENIISGLGSDPGVSSWTIANGGWEGTFSFDGSNVDFNLTAVPEPGQYAALGALFVLCVACWRRRRQ